MKLLSNRWSSLLLVLLIASSQGNASRLAGKSVSGFTGTPGAAKLGNKTELPVFSINDVRLSEGNSGTTAFTFTISLSSPSNDLVVVQYGTSPGTASEGGDYSPVAQGLYFYPGETTHDITVIVNGDADFEADETFNVVLTTGSPNATLGRSTGIGTIVNDDAGGSSMTASINDASVIEGDAGTKSMLFTVSLNNVPASFPSAGVKVNYETVDGTAIAGSDYTYTYGSVTLTRNTQSKLFSVPIIGDMTNEPQEKFLVRITSADVVCAVSEGTGTIDDNDPVPPTISISNVPSVTEGNAGTTPVAFMLTLSNPSTQVVTVSYSISSNGTAIAGTDYIDQSSQISFQPGEVSKIITVEVIGNTKYESNKTLSLNCSFSNATPSSIQGTVLVTNDDQCPVIVVSPASVPQGAVGSAYNVAFVANGGTAPYTYSMTGTLPAGLTFNNGNLTGVPAAGGANFSFAVTAKDANGCEGKSTYLFDVQDIPSISISSVSVSERNCEYANAVLSVTLSAASAKTVSVKYATADGTAKAGRDYVAASGTVTFAPGTTSMNITVKVKGDRTKETNEAFSVDLSGPVNGTLGASTGVVTIVNDDGLPKMWISSERMDEGNTGSKQMVFNVRLQKKSSAPVTVDFATADGTALAGSDYTAKSGKLSFAAGETEKSISVAVLGDVSYEPDESFTVRLSNPAGATLQDGTGTGTIENDDSKPVLSIGNASVKEGNSGTTPALFTVGLSKPANQTVTVYYATENESASSPSDYVATSGKLTFNPGETSKSVSVSVNGDAVSERDEDFVVRLSKADNASISDASGTGVIQNDDGSSIASRFEDLITYVKGLPSTAFQKPSDKYRSDLIEELNEASCAFQRGNIKSAQSELKEVLDRINTTGNGAWIVQVAVRQDLSARVLDLSMSLNQSVSAAAKDGQVFELAEDAASSAPVEFGLAQNYPNPFNPTTTIQYGLREPAMVTLKVYDMIGREVASLVEAYQSAGRHSVQFNGERLTSGTYIYRFQAGSFREVKKLVLMK